MKNEKIFCPRGEIGVNACIGMTSDTFHVRMRMETDDRARAKERRVSSGSLNFLGSRAARGAAHHGHPSAGWRPGSHGLGWESPTRRPAPRDRPLRPAQRTLFSYLSKVSVAADHGGSVNL